MGTFAVGALSAPLEQADPAAAPATPHVDDAVRADITASGAARVIVNLRDPEPGAPTGDLVARAQAVTDTQAAVLAQVATGDFALIHQYSYVPALAGVLTAEGLAALAALPEVASIQLDAPSEGHMGQSVPLLEANVVHSAFGLTGNNVTVAVLDSGVDLSHPDLVGSVVAQQCYNSGNPFGAGDCPPANGVVGTSAQDEHGHGTHVSSMITSNGAVAPVGFAPDAKIAAVRVLDSNNAGWLSDWIAGLEWVLARRATFGIRVVNMSLGTNALYSGNCDANWPAAANITRQLAAAGVVIFASSGNAGSSTQIASPACNSNVIAVGATYDANLGAFGCDAQTSPQTVTCFTNSNAELDILAPGSLITAARLGGGTVNFQGTSMASPTAAGIAALMLQANPSLTPAAIESILKTTGTLLTDPKNNRRFPLINARRAVANYGLIAGNTQITKLGLPGATVTYAIQVANTANINDTFVVTVSGNAWPTSAPAQIGPVAGKGNLTTVTVTVAIPNAAVSKQTSSATVTIRSQGDAGQTRTVALTTIATTTLYTIYQPLTRR